jgi:DNA-binding NtrC family response regulator
VAEASRLDETSRRIGCRRLARFGRWATAAGLGLTGCGEDAARVLDAGAEIATAPALDRLLHEWLLAQSVGDDERSARIWVRLTEAGVTGAGLWRLGSPDMHLVQSIPILLERFQEAEDELAALHVACRWLRRDGGADAVAFLDGHRSIVASDGWTIADTAGLADLPACAGDAAGATDRTGGVRCSAHVRYAGARTGTIVARGPRERLASIREAVNTAAVLCGPALRSRIDQVSATRDDGSLTPEILGRSPAIVALKEGIARSALTPFPVLIEGESGTGKELVARALHRLSPRRERPFSAVNCAALTDELVEAELFGHARGAFTGAVAARAGLFEEAHGGSLFLDEVSELSPRAQAKLLRVLQEREVRRVGENAPRRIDVRVIAATNRPLQAAVERAVFREDLLFRLAVVRLRLSPLRERVEDIPVIAMAGWRTLVAEAGKRTVLGADALARLCEHRWPGNVRELQNTLAALVVGAPARGRVAARHVDQVLAGRAEEPGPRGPLHRTRSNCERLAVAGALARHAGRRSDAARELGLTRQGLTKAIKRLGLDARPQAGVA